jgi:hypothetical protein
MRNDPGVMARDIKGGKVKVYGLTALELLMI